MEIEYKGGNSVVLKVGSVYVVVDPHTSFLGIKNTNTEGAVQLATETRFGLPDTDSKILVNGPGEYEVSGVMVKGVPARRHLDETGHASTMYSLVVAGFRVAIIGNIHPELTEDQLENIGMVDIAIVPVGGGGYTLDAHGAAAISRQLDPKIIIPIHYADKGLTYEVPQNELEAFLKEFGASEHEVLDKFKLKAGSTLPAVLTVIELRRT